MFELLQRKRMVKVLVLKDVNLREIWERHNTLHVSQQKSKIIVFNGEGKDETGSTDIVEGNLDERTFFITDPQQHPFKFHVNILSSTFKNIILPRLANKPCWNCRRTFNNQPIGAPIRFHSIKSCKIFEKERFHKFLMENNLPNDIIEFFETEGIFCWFPCAKRYCIDQIKLGRLEFTESLGLLTLLFSKLFGEIIDIPTGISFFHLTENGGHVQNIETSIDRYRYINLDNMQKPLIFFTPRYYHEIKNPRT